MLRLIVPEVEFFDEETESFTSVESCVLELEHSLISLSKWESKYQKPFLSSNNKTKEEILGYILSMISTPEVPENILLRLSQENFDEINAYIESTQSATTFGVMPERRGQGEIITAELIYYWMVAFSIPFECEHWHLNRLFALIRICNIKNDKPKKMSRHEIAMRNRQLNEQRRAQLSTTG